MALAQSSCSGGPWRTPAAEQTLLAAGAACARRRWACGRERAGESVRAMASDQRCGRMLPAHSWDGTVPRELGPGGSHRLSLLSLRTQSGIMETGHLGKWGASPYCVGGETEAGRNHCPQLPVDFSDRAR